MGMTLSRESFLHILAKDALARGLPEAVYLNFVDGKVRQATIEDGSFDVFFKVIWALKQEANRMLTLALQHHDEFYEMMARSNIKILDAIV